MKRSVQTATLLTALLVFVALPLLLYASADAPRRSLLKELLSIVTLLAFTAMLAQFFMARSNTWLLSVFKPPQIQKVHKYIAYTAVAVILAHPALIVLPRAFEGGVRPVEALVTMLTTFGNPALMAGFFAYLLLVVLALTALLRRPLIKRFSQHYRGWRMFHGGLAVAFTTLALWHAIALGRHVDLAMTIFFISLAALGFAMLAHLYRGGAGQTAKPVAKGATT